MGFKYCKRAWALFVPTGCAGSVVMGARTNGSTATTTSPFSMTAGMGSASDSSSSANDQAANAAIAVNVAARMRRAFPKLDMSDGS